MRNYIGALFPAGVLIALLFLASGGRAWAGEARQTIPTATTGAGPETPVAVPTALASGSTGAVSAATSNPPADPLPLGCIALTVAVLLLAVVIALFLSRSSAKSGAEQK
jgi:hypothetical protein